MGNPHQSITSPRTEPYLRQPRPENFSQSGFTDARLPSTVLGSAAGPTKPAKLRTLATDRTGYELSLGYCGLCLIRPG